MMRVRYEPAANRVATWAVYLINTTVWLIGFVTRSDDGRWSARLRSEPAVTLGGWVSRSDASRYLLIASKFAQEPTKPLRWVA